MAYFLSGSVIINDNRELIGINTAGISTALYVGENIELNAGTGIVTATAYYGDGSNLTGVGLNTATDYEVNNLVAIGSVTAANYYGDGSDLINIPGLSWIATGTQTTRPDGTAIQDGDIYYDPDDLRQFTYYTGDGGNWRDSNPAANSAVKVTVGLETAQIIPGEDTLTFAPVPDTGEIVIGINTLTDTVTLGIDDDLRVGTSLQVGAGISAYGSTIISADGTPISYFGDGSNLTGIGLTAGDNVITTGDIQAGVITATTQLDANVASGVGLTVTSDAYIGGTLSINGQSTFTGAVDANGGLNVTGGGGLIANTVQASNLQVNQVPVAGGGGQLGGSAAFEFDGTTLKVGTAVTISAGIVTATEFYGDGSNLTGIGLAPDSNIVTTGDIQAGVITATTQLDANVASGIGLTVTADAFIGGDLEIDGNLTIGAALTIVDLTAEDIEATTQLKATVATGIGLTVTADAYIGGNVTIAGDLDANDVNTTSDISKKENIQEIGDALAKVSQLKGVTFDWKESGESSGGIIAQDVEKVLPTLVRDGDDHKTVIYNGVIGLLVQAVKELSEEVAELKKAQ